MMLAQPWLTDPDWERNDPKMREALDQPMLFPHTSALAASIEIHPPGFLLIRGPRQVGKSTLLRQFAKRCLGEGIAPANLLICDAEKAIDRHQMLIDLEAFFVSRKGFIVVLLDEITVVPQWWLVIKLLADQGISRNALILGTGSSAEDLRAGADLLPGRRGKRYPVDFELLPVTFRSVKDRLGIKDYLLTGGFPWAINEFLRHGFIPSYVYNLHASGILGTFMKRRVDAGGLGELLRYLPAHQGSPTSVSSLARDCNIGSNHTAEEYLDLLDRIYAILPCAWAEPGTGKTPIRKNRKFYAADPFLFHVLCTMGRGWDSAFEEARARLGDPAMVGRMVEGLVAAEVRRRQGSGLKYWQGAKEIDFVGETFVEVKFQNQVSPAEFDWARDVIPKGKRLVVVTKQTKTEAGIARLIPLEEWLCESH